MLDIARCVWIMFRSYFTIEPSCNRASGVIEPIGIISALELTAIVPHFRQLRDDGPEMMSFS